MNRTPLFIAPSGIEIEVRPLREDDPVEEYWSFCMDHTDPDLFVLLEPITLEEEKKWFQSRLAAQTDAALDTLHGAYNNQATFFWQEDARDLEGIFRLFGRIGRSDHPAIS